MSSDRTLRIGAWFFRRRDHTPIPLIALILLFAAPSRETMLVGGAVSLLGEALRFWGVASIGSISRTRARAVGGLMDRGAFSVVRNPLYVGNFLLSLGLVVASGAPVTFAVPAYLLFFAVQYFFIFRWEESVLREELGAPYLDYLQRVPRWLPAPWLFRPGRPDWAKAVRSEWPTMLAVALALAAMAALFLLLDGATPIDRLLR